MTWTKLGDEFSDECANAGISDAAYRTHVEAIAWVYRVERMDCRIPKHLIRRFAGSDHYEAAVKDLVALEWWTDATDHYEITHHGDVIRASITAQQKRRVKEKEASRRYRKRQQEARVMDDVMDDVTDDADRQTDRHAFEGEQFRTEHVNTQTGEVTGSKVCPTCRDPFETVGEYCTFCNAPAVVA